MSKTDADNAVREYIVGRITLIVDNDRDIYTQVQGLAVETLRSNDIHTKDQFLDAANDRGPYTRRELELEIGSAVSDAIEGWVMEGTAGSVQALVSDVFDFSDRAQRQLLGAHYWPDDDEAFDDDEEDDE